MQKNRRITMARFIYWNENPNGEHIGDCVVRAITLATGLPYEDVEDKLWLTAELLGCVDICPFCYRNLLENVFQFREVNPNNMTIREFADTHSYGTYILRIPSHLTCIIDGDLYDIWDCRDSETITDAWQAE